MQHILAVDLGTYCDNKLMEYAMESLASKYKVVYLTDEKHNVPTQYTKVGFKTPEFFTNDPKIKIANTKRNFYAWVLSHPDKALQAYSWSEDIRRKIRELSQRYAFKSICMLYPALGMVWLLPEELDVPIYVFYYAPGILSKNIPWIFDSVLKEKSYKLYAKKNQKYNMESGLEYLKRISYLSGKQETVHQTMKKINHVVCWDKNVTPPIELLYDDYKTYYAGTLLSTDISKKRWPADPVVSGFVKSKERIVFVSFGSYAGSELLENSVKNLMEQLEALCGDGKTGVIYHNGPKANKVCLENGWLLKVDGFIKYEYVVPRSALVVFTGSACLQNICLYNCVPMLFLPLLCEQFYWAKNYMHFTSVPYIDYRSTRKNKIDFAKAMEKNSYLQDCSRSIKRNKAHERIAKIV